DVVRTIRFRRNGTEGVVQASRHHTRTQAVRTLRKRGARSPTYRCGAGNSRLAGSISRTRTAPHQSGPISNFPLFIPLYTLSRCAVRLRLIIGAAGSGV